MIDLCAACVGTVYDPRIHTQIIRSTDPAELGDVRAVTPHLAQRLIEGWACISTPYGDMSMLAVTTVNGSRLCGICATRVQEADRARRGPW